jgi:hypothetical protein
VDEKKEQTPSKRVCNLIKQALSLTASFFLCQVLAFRESELTEHSFALSPSQSSQAKKQLAVKRMSPSDVVNICM